MSRYCQAGKNHIWVRQDNRAVLCCSLREWLPNSIKLEKTEDVEQLIHSSEWQEKYQQLNTGPIDYTCDYCVESESQNGGSQRLKINRLYEESNNKFFLKLDFSNKCNLKCLMCNSTRSTGWIKDEQRLQKLLQGEDILHEKWPHPYQSLDDDWWTKTSKSWWDQIGVIELSGGEPLYQENAIDFLEFLSYTNSSISLRIITNATLIDEKILDILGKFENIKLLCSVDAWEDHVYEYSRGGHISLDEVKRNIKLLSDKKIRMAIVDTVHCLTYDQYEVGAKWLEQNAIEVIHHNVNFVYQPQHLNVHNVLPQHLYPSDNKDIKLQKTFYKWITALDTVRKTNVLDIRPEFESWFKELEKQQ